MLSLLDSSPACYWSDMSRGGHDSFGAPPEGPHNPAHHPAYSLNPNLNLLWFKQKSTLSLHNWVAKKETLMSYVETSLIDMCNPLLGNLPPSPYNAFVLENGFILIGNLCWSMFIMFALDFHQNKVMTQRDFQGFVLYLLLSI